MMKNGFGVLKDSNGTEIVGFWKDDMIEGYSIHLKKDHSKNLIYTKNNICIHSSMSVVTKLDKENHITVDEFGILVHDERGEYKEVFVFYNNHNTSHEIFDLEDKTKAKHKIYDKENNKYLIINLINNKAKGKCCTFDLKNLSFSEDII
jgi:hypothetical protein